MPSLTFVGYPAQIVETRRQLARGLSFTAAELAEHLDVSTSRANDIIAELISTGEVTTEGRPRRITAANR